MENSSRSRILEKDVLEFEKEAQKQIEDLKRESKKQIMAIKAEYEYQLSRLPVDVKGMTIGDFVNKYQGKVSKFFEEKENLDESENLNNIQTIMQNTRIINQNNLEKVIQIQNEINGLLYRHKHK